MAALSYGYSRTTIYDLVQADGQSETKRFGRNMLEYNAAVVGAFALSGLTEVLLKKLNRRPGSKTSVLFNGKQVGIVLNF